MKTLTQQEAKEQGFIIDTCCYPNIAYKGPRFNPKEHHYAESDREMALRLEVEHLQAELAKCKTARIEEIVNHFDDAIECARLIGSTEAKKALGVYTQQDSVCRYSMYESIAKHRAAINLIAVDKSDPINFQWQPIEPVKAQAGEPCTVSEVSSRCCERGTKGCVVTHSTTEPVKAQGEGVHDWKCVDSGMYDSWYECTKCGTKHFEQIDNLSTTLPKLGCISIKAQVVWKPIGYARKQDLLEYKPVIAMYSTKLEAENGHECVALYSEDQLITPAQSISDAERKETNELVRYLDCVLAGGSPSGRVVARNAKQLLNAVPAGYATEEEGEASKGDDAQVIGEIVDWPDDYNKKGVEWKYAMPEVGTKLYSSYGVPTGHRIVPIEPTDEMLKAAFLVGGCPLGLLYQTMINAAPEPTKGD